MAAIGEVHREVQAAPTVESTIIYNSVTLLHDRDRALLSSFAQKQQLRMPIFHSIVVKVRTFSTRPSLNSTLYFARLFVRSRQYII